MSAVDNFILNQPMKLKELLITLDHLLVSEFGLMSKIAWGIPVYYSNQKNICYLKPLKSKTAVEFCFIRGHELDDTHKILAEITRRMVKGVLVEEVTEDLLKRIKDLVFNAVCISNN